ncbi:class I SAM-dependent methyltransferase [Halorubellus salinus]|uniref:class I SAM-dependent methyltransferase n=1 Tax=Halorubellus salinus TaxID=755309 RepID=UPI001D065C93|nr:class I SAM-dependent methyltransferase [Halorubellus salinus]
MTDVFARALHEWFHDEYDGPLRYRDGEEPVEHGVAGYFEAWSLEDGDALAGLDAPVLDLGAGAGRQALAVQEHATAPDGERPAVSAVEPSELLASVLRDRGVDRVVQADMFSLREHFERDAFRGAYSVGTQVGIAKSLPGLRAFLGDLTHVTTPDATAVFDGYDPDHERTRDLFGFREDPAGEHAFRVVQYEYDEQLGKPWLFQLFTPDDVRDAVADTAWTVESIREGGEGWEHAYTVTLAKQ